MCVWGVGGGGRERVVTPVLGSVSVCVCVRDRVCVNAYMYVYMRIYFFFHAHFALAPAPVLCVRECVCERERDRENICVHIYKRLLIYINRITKKFFVYISLLIYIHTESQKKKVIKMERKQVACCAKLHRNMRKRLLICIYT